MPVERGESEISERCASGTSMNQSIHRSESVQPGGPGNSTSDRSNRAWRLLVATTIAACGGQLKTSAIALDDAGIKSSAAEDAANALEAHDGGTAEDAETPVP